MPDPDVSPMTTLSPELQATLEQLNPGQDWQPTTLTVYARPLLLTTTRVTDGIALLPFSQLCQANLGPADYISICSTFHTLIVTQIPVLTLLMKNEARRFITFLDACYEARCRLIIEAAAPPDRLFFPETRARRGNGNMLEDRDNDSITSEAFSEMYQDSTAPFRPNISSYVGANENERENVAAPSSSLHNKDLRSVLADEDADFGPTYGNRRSSSGFSSSAADYDSDGAALDERHPGPQGMAELEIRQGPDFTQGAGAFTGQDEQFAYKRARSRLWEMCGRRWWSERRSDNVESWWTPVMREGRFWEKQAEIKEAAMQDLVEKQGLRSDVRTSGEVGGSHDGRARGKMSGTEKEDALFRHGASPFRTSAEPPPKFGWQHAWGMMKWGRKAGEWGKGVEGDRRKPAEDQGSKDQPKSTQD